VQEKQESLRSTSSKVVGLAGSEHPFPRQEWFWDVVVDVESVAATRRTEHSPLLNRTVAMTVVKSGHAAPGIVVEVVHPCGAESMEVVELPSSPAIVRPSATDPRCLT
jgi:glycine cleavage system aminomethyltransferase T